MCKMKFEELMQYECDNWDGFLRLVENFDRIACYIGTGLSLYYTSWGEPFVWILNHMRDNGYLEELDESAISVSKEYGIPVNTKDGNSIYAELLNYINDRKYLEVGEVLETVLKKYGTTFNAYFCRAIRDRNNKAAALASRELERVKKGALPEASIYYIPYIGGILQGTYITTNCDISIETVFKDLLTSYHQYSGADLCPRDLEHAKDNENNERQIFYIHGRVHPEIDSSKSLVMIATSYNEKYGDEKNESFNIKLLREMSKSKTFLFLGASLEEDPAVKFIKPQIRPAECPHVAFFKMPTISSEEKKQYIARRKQYLNDLSIGTMFLPDFLCYSTVLCQLIREKKSEFWDFQSIFCRCSVLDMERNSVIDGIMESTDEFMYRNMDQDNAQSILAALGRYVYEKETFKRKPGWSVCYVESEDFEFPINKQKNGEMLRPENFNAPLGNTVYLISSILSKSYIQMIVIQMRGWLKQNREAKSGFQNIKIRMIVFRGNGETKRRVCRETEGDVKNKVGDEEIEEIRGNKNAREDDETATENNDEHIKDDSVTDKIKEKNENA